MSLLHKLLEKVNAAPVGSAELDKDIIVAFPITSRGITKSIDAIVHLIETELPGWWWVCGSAGTVAMSGPYAAMPSSLAATNSAISATAPRSQ